MFYRRILGFIWNHTQIWCGSTYSIRWRSKSGNFTRQNSTSRIEQI